MIDYDPRVWKSTRMIRGYTYYMKKPLEATKQKLQGIRYRINDCMIYSKPYLQKGRLYYGWIKMDEQLDIFDAMEAGLVPNYHIKVGETDETTES